MGFHKQGHYRNPRKKRVVVLEELNFIWDDPELNVIAEMWGKVLMSE